MPGWIGDAELYALQEATPTAADRADPREGCHWGRPRWEMVPTGKLVLDAGWDNVWSEGRERPIEDRVDKALADILKDAEGFRIRREQEEQQRRAAEDTLRQKELEAQQIREMGFLGYLYRDMPSAEPCRRKEDDEGFYWELYRSLYPDER